MDKPKKKGSKYPMVSEAYPYEYQKAIKDSRMDLASLYFGLPPEEQQRFGDVEGFIENMTGNIDAPIQIVDRERGPDFKFKKSGENLLSGLGVGMLGYGATGQIPFVNQMVTGDPTVYDTATYGGDIARTLLPGAAGLATALLMQKTNPARYQAKSREAVQQGLNDIMQGRIDEYQSPRYLPYDYRGMKADMSEMQYMPNAQNGMMVQGEDQMGGGEQEQQQAQLQQTIVKLIQQFKTPEAIQKYLIQQGIDRQSLSQVMMMVQQMMQGQEPQYEDGGMPAEIALARFKASGREKGLVGGELEAHVEKMKSRYGYQKGGAVKAEDVNPFDVRDMFESGGRVEYRGHSFPGYNKPIKAPAGDKHKKMVLVKRGDKIRLIKYGLRGMQDYTQHKDEKRRKNYLARSGGIKNKSGQLTKNDPFSANYWARRDLW